ncbi:hypothetical protein CHGG_09371 [Chaetomium globosum CBS 148.51]|uniref:DUF6604 domain-containing protein n=1 Tax=Chaetomium globosum (strain ATCC 6205 / CBS 148.51 / DSM 1962 / NBRC 6347 / NRRL 1970) TaxID=306901 RepID=Q2GRN3_CHAGB|nr:uncharacterized protein CHGG_09371 [Chaetomium globosum CBS 148.51]EAQ85357.1 hypothetical protein CHGG_09371 [Chaetomium globosum CBS 148.51]
MATRNVYLAYKRDTSQLLYWIIRTSNVILLKTTASSDSHPTQVNTTGQITVTDLVALSRLIARHVNPVPFAILQLFRSVIDARTAAHESFQQMATEHPDPSIEKSNATHRYFIVALTDAFHELGGRDWKPTDDCSADGAAADDTRTHSKAKLDRLLLSNQFMALDLSNTTDIDKEASESDDSNGHPERGPDPAQKRRRQPKPGKGKKGKRGKKSKAQQQAARANEALLDSVPLESYRIIQDGEGVDTDYIVALYAILSEWVSLRQYIQSVWRKCAYCGLNSAVAGAVSQLAITMVQKSAAEIFVDFPGRDYYETVMDLIGRAGPKWDISRIATITIETFTPEGKAGMTITTPVDFGENLMLDTHRNLWDPGFSLQGATDEERTRWRRYYTMNWLYGLVNHFSSIVVKENTLPGEPHVLEDVDWSPTGPWAKHRRLFGLNGFAGLITSLALQKQGTDIRKSILPHIVFSLQCIVDSFMVSRGWRISIAGTHTLEPPAQNFRPLRDIDIFLDRENERKKGAGLLPTVTILKQFCANDATIHHDPNRHEYTNELLQRFHFEFAHLLGGNVLGCDTDHGPIHPSRFSGTNSNGLWEYSPFLCGVGLTEGLDLAYLLGMRLWDNLSEPILLVHLHNMLVKKGYLKESSVLFDWVQYIFGGVLFVSGKVPSSNFSDALVARSDQAARSRRRDRHAAQPPANDSYDPFQALATVDPVTQQTRLDDTDLVKRARATGMIEETLLQIHKSQCRCRSCTVARGLSSFTTQATANATTIVYESGDDTSDDAGEDASVTISAAAPAEDMDPDREHDEAMAHLPPTPPRRKTKTKTKTTSPHHHRTARNPRKPTEAKPQPTTTTTTSPPQLRYLTGQYILLFAERDLTLDITDCRFRPLSAVNYVAVACTMMGIFQMMEAELARRRNALYVHVYERDETWAEAKRVGLGVSVICIGVET